MPKNDVQLLQEVVDKLGSQLANMGDLLIINNTASASLVTASEDLTALLTEARRQQRRGQDNVLVSGVDGGASANVVALHQYGNVVNSDERVIFAPMFKRPADTTQYAVADLVADSTTAALVNPIVFLVPKPRFHIVGAGLFKSGTSVTSASFRMHFYTQNPNSKPGIIANGDNAAWSTTLSGYVGAVDLNVDAAFSDGAFGRGGPRVANSIPVNIPISDANATTGSRFWALIEVRDTYTPASAEQITPFVELVF